MTPGDAQALRGNLQQLGDQIAQKYGDGPATRAILIELVLETRLLREALQQLAAALQRPPGS